MVMRRGPWLWGGTMVMGRGHGYEEGAMVMGRGAFTHVPF